MSRALYLPGRGMVDLRVTPLERAVREYDDRLRVGVNKATGQWCVFIQVERGTLPPEMDNLYPVLGLGMSADELPSADRIKKMLYEMDTVRHGDELLNKLNRHNAELKKQQEAKVKEAQAQTAEAFEWGIRRMSNDIGKRRVQVNMGEPVSRRRPEVK